MNRQFLLASILFILAIGTSACRNTQKVPDPVILDAPRLFYGPTFHGENQTFKAISVDKEGIITELFDEVPTDLKGFEAIEIPGRFATPGLHDAHIHPIGVGRKKDRINLRGIRSPEKLRARIQRFVDWRGDRSVVQGRGWDQSRFKEKVFPTKEILQGISEHPILLRRIDGHALLTNDVAMKKAGIDSNTPDPEGGRILRDSEGEPTGIFIDNAIDLVMEKMPKPTAEEYRRWIEDGLYACADNGLTAVHDMGFPIDALGALKDLDDEDLLPIRVFLYLDGSDKRAVAALKKWKFSKMVSIQGIKLYADGAMGSRGAALLQPYADDPENSGLLLTPPELLQSRIQAVHDLGFQSATHSIGDRGIRTTLNAIEAVQGAQRSIRHRVEHAQLVHPDDFPRFKSLGVIASMQPTHATSDMRWAKERVGEERLKGAYAWRTMLKLGVPLAFGSDAPIESHKVRFGIWAAVTRQDRSRRPRGGWRSEQRLTIDETLKAFSQGAAFAVGREKDLGRFEVGYEMDASIFKKEGKKRLSHWLGAQSTAIIVGGRVLFRNEADNVKSDTDPALQETSE